MQTLIETSPEPKIHTHTGAHLRYCKFSEKQGRKPKIHPLANVLLLNEGEGSPTLNCILLLALASCHCVLIHPEPPPGPSKMGRQLGILLVLQLVQHHKGPVGRKPHLQSVRIANTANRSRWFQFLGWPRVCGDAAKPLLVYSFHLPCSIVTMVRHSDTWRREDSDFSGSARQHPANTRSR